MTNTGRLEALRRIVTTAHNELGIHFDNADVEETVFDILETAVLAAYDVGYDVGYDVAEEENAERIC